MKLLLLRHLMHAGAAAILLLCGFLVLPGPNSARSDPADNLLHLAGHVNLPGTCTSAPTGHTVTYGTLVCHEFRYVCRDNGFTLVVYSMECNSTATYDGSTFIQTP